MSDAHNAPLELPSVIAWRDLSAEPWRNGGGVTRQIVSMRRSDSGDWMPAADDWDLRLSIADVDAAGAFSSFPGMTRILTVIDGASVTLTVDGAVEQLEKHRPFEFDGGAETSAELPHGPIRDLNLIARTGIVDAAVSVEPLTAGMPRTISDGQYCVVLEGHASVTLGAADTVEAGMAAEVELGRFDTVLGSAQHPLSIAGDGVLAVITISARTRIRIRIRIRIRPVLDARNLKNHSSSTRRLPTQRETQIIMVSLLSRSSSLST